jgi:O-antigen ligase
MSALSARDEGRARAGLGMLLVALPFVWPVVDGPSVNAWQAFASLWCVALLWLLGPVKMPRAAVCGLLAALTVLVLWRREEIGLWLPTLGAIAAMGLAASCGAGMGRRELGALAWGLLGAGLISAVLGLLQYYGLAEPLVPWTTTPALGQAYGNLRQRNQFATLISMALLAALWLHAAASGSARHRRWLAAPVLLLLAAAAAATSRTGLLQLLTIFGVAAFIARRERGGLRAGNGNGNGNGNGAGAGDTRFLLPPPWLLLAPIPLYFALSWLLPHLAGGGVDNMLHRLHEGAPGDHSRLILWGNVLALIARRPWTGWGWGELSFAHYSTLYTAPRFVEILDNAHNLPLHLAVELGIPAAVLLCGGFAWLVLAARPWRERDPSRLLAWGILGAIVLHSLVEYPLWYGPFQLMFGLCLGILWPGRRSVRGLGGRDTGSADAADAEPSALYRLPAMRTAAALALMAAVSYAAWDYIRISQIYEARDDRLPAYQDDTLAKLHGSWLFANQVRFAELTLTTVTRANAAEMHALAERTLHFSPEPRVIVKLIESAVLLGREDEAYAQAERFSIAFPDDYARWLRGEALDAPAP